MKLENQEKNLGLGYIKSFANRTNEIIGEESKDQIPDDSVIEMSVSQETVKPRRFRPMGKSSSTTSQSDEDVKKIIKETVQEAQKNVKSTETNKSDVEQSFKDKLMMRLGINKRDEEILDDTADDVEVVNVEPLDPETEAKRKEAIEKIKKYSIRTVVALAIIGAFAGAVYKLWNIIKNELPEKSEDLDSSISTMATPEPTPTEAPELVENTTIAPEVVAKNFYNYLLECEKESEENAAKYQENSDTDSFEYRSQGVMKLNLPNGEDTILNMYYALHPELGIASNLTKDEVISLCNGIAGNCHYHYFKTNLAMLLQGYDESIVNEIDYLDTLASKIKRENYNGDYTNGLFTEEQIKKAEANGVNAEDDKEFFNKLLELCDKLPTDDINNLPYYVLLDAFYTGVTSKSSNYIIHYPEGAEASVNYLMLDGEILNEENYQKFDELNKVETKDLIPVDTITNDVDNYYNNVIVAYENNYNVKFENIDSIDTLKELYNYFNGLDTMDPERAHDICKSIYETCKTIGVSPQFELLIANERNSEAIKKYGQLLDVLKVDYDTEDDKKVFSYIGETFGDSTGIVNYGDPKQNSLLVLVKSMFDSYSKELYHYIRTGKTYEFEVNGDPSYSCAGGINDDLENIYSSIIEQYETEQSLKRSR